MLFVILVFVKEIRYNILIFVEVIEAAINWWTWK